METDILLASLDMVCKAEAKYLDSEEEQDDARCGDYGQWDDTYDAGIRHGRAELAAEIQAMLDED
jgi:hypothetical protein